ncbi:hypothetical protein [Helicobacter canis]|nr:hypothetical protein [Helicobacter canis]
MDSSTTMLRIVFLESTFDLSRFSVIASLEKRRGDPQPRIHFLKSGF